MNYEPYIQRILDSRLFIVLSWGYEKPEPIENGLRFQVSGRLHKGKVEILYNEGNDAFDVTTLDNHDVPLETVQTVYVEDLVDTIDRLVVQGPKKEND